MTATLEDFGRTIERRWVQLDTQPGAGIRVIDLPDNVEGGPILLGFGPDGARLLVPFSGVNHERFRPDRSSSGIQLLVTPLGTGDDVKQYLDVLCPKRELRWLFATFVADVLLRIARDPSIDPTQIVRTCFSSWKSMFSRHGRRLSLKQLAGLYGELIVLRRLLQRSTDLIATWRGPLREPHDFRGGGTALEVKTTLSTEDQVVHIHGLEQLTAPAGADLHLMHLRVELSSGQGESIPDIVADVMDLVPPEKLKGLLQGAGYYDTHVDEYEHLSFQVVAEEVHRVASDFPRLSAESFAGGQIPTGLADFSYSLDLATVTSPTLPAGAVEALLDRITP